MESKFMGTALVLIDIQKDYFPGGRMELVHGSFLAALGAVYAKIRTTDDILEGITAGRA